MRSSPNTDAGGEPIGPHVLFGLIQESCCPLQSHLHLKVAKHKNPWVPRLFATLAATISIVGNLLTALHAHAQAPCPQDSSMPGGTSSLGLYSEFDRDITDRLQRAIDAAGSSTLIMPKGTYLISGLRLPRQGIHLIGDGATLLLNPTAPDGTAIITIPRGAADIRIEGLSIDGNPAASGGRRINGIASEGRTKRVMICGNRISGIPRNSIVLNNGDQSWDIRQNRIQNSGRFGVLVDFLTVPVTRISITANEISGSSEGPISFIANNGGVSDVASAGVWDAFIARNKVQSNGQGISGYSPNNRDIIVLQNEIAGSGVRNVKGHAAHWAGKNIKILENTIADTALSAIMISSWPNNNPEPVAGYEIRRNHIDGVTSLPGGSGILIQNASDGEIVDNIIKHVMESGIRATGAALGTSQSRIKNINIHDNRIVMDQTCSRNAQHEQYGIAVLHAEGATIAKNLVSGSCRAGLFTRAVSGDIRDNVSEQSVTGPGLEMIETDCLRFDRPAIIAHNSLQSNARGSLISSPACR